MIYTVKKLAVLAGITPRTLRYYDRIGLLKPSHLKANGYRCYGEGELARLQQILFFRELNFPLADIVQMINSPSFDQITALKDHRHMLLLKRQRLDNLLNTVDTTINKLNQGENYMTDSNLFASFDESQLKEYQKEAKARWGNTDAYKQSAARTAHWTKADYANAVTESKKFIQKLADTMPKGHDSPEFQDLVRQHHQSISKFYDCSLEMLRALSRLYVDDPRFKKTYDSFRPGLAEFMEKAVNYYCDHQQS